jgi:hypothetical protein
MAITSGVCNSFKQELLGMATHVSSDVFKFVLIKAGHSGTYGVGTTNVGTPGAGVPTSINIGTDAVAVSGGYNSVNGITLAGLLASLDTNTAVLTFTDPAALAAATISADGLIIYNSTKSNKAVAVFSFGSTITSTNDAFDVNLPAATAAAGLVRIS